MTLADEFRIAFTEASLEVDAERFAEGVRNGGKIYAAPDVFKTLGGTLAGHPVEECKYMEAGTIVAVKFDDFFKILGMTRYMESGTIVAVKFDDFKTVWKTLGMCDG